MSDLSGQYKSQPVSRIGSNYQPELLRPILTEMNRELLRRADGNGSGGRLTTSHHYLTDLTYYDDHPQYLYLAGRAPGQTLTSKSAATVPFRLKHATGQSAAMFQVVTTADARQFVIWPAGQITVGDIPDQAFNLHHANIKYGIQIYPSNTSSKILQLYGSTWQAVTNANIIRSVGDGTGMGGLVLIGDSTAGNVRGYIRIATVGTSDTDANAYIQGDRRLNLTNIAGTALVLARISATTTELTGALQLDGSTSGSVTLSAGTTPTAHTLKLPPAQGSALQVLRQSATPGTLEWATLSAATFTHEMLDSTVHTDTLTGTVVRGDLIVGNATPKWARAPIGAANTFLKSDGTDPAWTAGAALTRVDDTNVTLALGGSATTALVNAASLTLGWTGQLSIARGGTGQASATAAFNALSPLTTRGDLPTNDGTNDVRLPIGGPGTFLRSDGTDPSWQALTAAMLPAHDHSGSSQGGGTLAPTAFSCLDNGFTLKDNLDPTKQAQFQLSSLLAGMSMYTLLSGGGTVPLWEFDNGWGGTNLFAGTVEVADGTKFKIKNDSDNTKAVTFDCSTVPTGTTRQYVFPDFSGILVAVGRGTDPPVTVGDVAVVNRTGRTANISPAVNFTFTARPGFYLVCTYIACTTAGSGTVTINFNYTDDGGAHSNQNFGSISMASVNSATTVKTVYLTGGEITWTTSGHVSGTYAIRMRGFYLGA